MQREIEPKGSPETAWTGVAILDRPQLRLKWANCQFCHLLGRTEPAQQLCGCALSELLPQGNGPWTPLMERLAESAAPGIGQAEYRAEGLPAGAVGWRLAWEPLGKGDARADLILQLAPLASDEAPSVEQLRWLARFPEENPAPVLRLASDGRMLYANPAAQAQGWRAVPGAVATAEFTIPAQRAFQEGRTLEAELTFEGRVFSALFRPAGPEINVYAYDITERKRTEEARRESEERLRLMVAASKAGWWHWDLVENRVLADAQTKAVFGVASDADVSFQTFLDCLAPGEAPVVLGNLPRALSEWGDFEAEFHVIWPDGSHHWVQGRGRAFRNAAGEPQRLLGLVQDITERRQAEAAQREWEERLRLMLDVTNVGWWDWDLPQNKLTADAKARAVIGLPQGVEPSYQAFLERLPPDEIDQIAADFPLSYPFKGDFDREFHVIWPDGSHHWVIGRGRAFCDESGNPIRLIGLLMDVTQRKLAETEIQRHREELAHAARLATMGELAASIAHELNQPLAAIQSNADAAELLLAQQTPSLGDMREILADIRKDNRRAAEVIRRMRSLLQKQPIKSEPLDLNELVNDTARLVSAHAGMRRVTIRLQLGERLPRLQGDRVHLQQVLINLAVNGMDAMTDSPAEQRVLLLTTRRTAAQEVEALVSDRGPGIAADILARLFQPFHTTKTEGMGMGLSIARTIIEAHGGRIWAQNNPEGGAAVGFVLPCPGVDP